MLGEEMVISFVIDSANSFKASIYLFDPKFFLPKRDSSVIPFLLLDNPMFKGIYLHSTYTSQMNRPKDPCNPDKSYNYNHCVKTNLAKQIGSTNPFDDAEHALNDPNFQPTEQLMDHFATNLDIFNVNKQHLFNITGCEFPCHFHKYSVVGTPLKWEVKGEPFVNLFYTSTDLMTSQEVLLYPFDSLVSEFGGALGLFLGFSFLGLLDIIQTGCNNILTRIKIDRSNLTVQDV